MTVQELRDILKDYPDDLFVVVDIPSPITALTDVDVKMKAPLLVAGILPGHIHVRIDGSKPQWRRRRDEANGSSPDVQPATPESVIQR